MSVEVCNIHDEILVAGEAEVRIGYYRFTNEFYRAKERLFPYSRSFQIEGRVHSFEPKTDKVDFCPSCRDAENQWMSENDPHG